MADSIKPTAAAKRAAARGLQARREAVPSQRGGLSPQQAGREGVGSGVARARDIVAGRRVDPKRVHAFFTRFAGEAGRQRRKHKDWLTRPEKYPLAQSWLLWGGDPLRRQAAAAVKKGDNPTMKSCGPGKIRRKGYTTKRGTRVASTCIVDRGRPGRGKKVVKGIKEGGLGGPGYTEKSREARHKILAACVKKDGYRTCLGRLQYLLLVGARTWPKSKLKVVQDDKKWLMKTYGGKGSFEAETRRLKNGLLR